MDMTRAGLLLRLANHLAGELSYDAQGEQQRLDAIEESYTFISTRWQLYTKPIAFGQPNASGLISDDPTPPDFISYTGRAGFYNATPPPLSLATSVPWNGKYPTAAQAITLYAAFRLFEDKGPEMYEKAMYWRQRFDMMAERLDAEDKRRLRTTLDIAGAGTFTYAALQQLISYNLEQSDMLQEERHRKFPIDVIAKAINRAYLDISNKFELNIGIFTTSILAPNQITPLPADVVAPAMTSATLGGVTVVKVAGTIQPDTSLYDWVASVPSYRIVTVGASRMVQVAGMSGGSYPLPFTMYYEGKPTELINPTDKPWGGLYDDAFKLISFKVMRDMLYGDTKTYNISRFWQNEYEREERDFKRILRRLSSGSRVAAFGYSRTETESASNGMFAPINSPDSSNS